MKKILSILVLIAVLALPLTVSSAADITDVLWEIADWLKTLVYALAVIMFIYAGILFLTSSGNVETLGKAKKTIFYGVIGLAIALLAEALKAAVVGWV